VAPLAPVPTLRALSDLEATAVAPQRYELTLLVLFAVLALLLAAMGVYALVAHSVARRRKELALRTTLGASAADLWRLVLRQALAPVASGVAVGLIAAIVVGRLLTAMLFQVTPFSPIVLGPVALAVLVAAGAACLLPMRRAIRVDPWTALRAE
jgi:ABC-type antimicrobial peptide transport system permease subunit